MDPKAPPTRQAPKGLFSEQSKKTEPGLPTDPKGWERIKKSTSWQSRYMPFNLQVNMHETRHRTAGMTPDERAWRKKWILDQKVPDHYPLDTDVRPRNPIRRFFSLPADIIQDKVLNKVFGWYRAHHVRSVLTFSASVYAGMVVVWYCLKYNTKTWESFRGFLVYGEEAKAHEHSMYEGPRWTNRERVEEAMPGVMAKLETPNSQNRSKEERVEEAMPGVMAKLETPNSQNRSKEEMYPPDATFFHRTVLRNLDPPERP